MYISFEPKLNVLKLDDVPVSLHCHHYNCGLVKSLEEIEGINAREIIIKATAEEFYINFRKYISNHLPLETYDEKFEEASKLYRFMGFGRLNLEGLDEQGGIAYADSSYYVIGWLAKYGRREPPVCYLTCGFIKGIMAAIYDVPIINYDVEEKKCMITGHEFCEFIVSLNRRT